MYAELWTEMRWSCDFGSIFKLLEIKAICLKNLKALNVPLANQIF